MLLLFIFAIALSLDSFTVGVAYGIRKMQIPTNSLFILFFCSSIVMFLSVGVGKVISTVLNDNVCKAIGGTLLIILGSWMLIQKAKEMEEEDKLKDEIEEVRSLLRFEIKSVGLVIQILKTPTIADFDKSGRITGWEAFMLALALSIDSFSAGIGMSVLGYSPLLIALFVASLSSIFLKIGVDLGNKFCSYAWAQKVSVFSGLLLIIIGFWRI